MSEGTDADNGLTDLLRLDAAGGRAELAFVELAHSITTGRAAYPRRYGQDFLADLLDTVTELTDQRCLLEFQLAVDE